MADDRVPPIEAEPPPPPVSPVQPVRAERVAPLATPAAIPQDAQLGAAAERAELAQPVTHDASVDRRAAVHDAAEHGDPIAAAIERAQSADPNDRARLLAGAAASAGSGQSAVVDIDAGETPDPPDDFLRPVDPVTRDRVEPDPAPHDPRTDEEH